MSPLPVHVLTGFLGSGKTTLLGALVRQPAFADTAVVVNELGEIGLDHVLVSPGSEDDVVLLDSGCLCCALGNSLQETLESLYFRRLRGDIPPFARVVIETTGVADPGPIAATLGLDSAIARHYRLGSIVTVVDAVHGEAQLERFAEARRQVAIADRIVVTKRDAASDRAHSTLAARLRALAPHATVGEAIRGAIAADEVFVDPLRPNALEGLSPPQASHDHARDDAHADACGHDHLARSEIASTAIRLDAPLSWSRYAEWVRWMQQAFGERLLRMKGAVQMDDGSAQALHGVMLLFNAPVALPSLPRALGHGAIVVIAHDVPSTLLDEARRRIAVPDYSSLA